MPSTHKTLLLAALLPALSLAQGCLDGETIIVGGHMDVPVTIEVATDVASPQEVSFPVSVSSWVRISEFEVTLTHLEPHAADGDAGDETGDAHKTMRPADAGHDETPADTGTAGDGGETPHLEDVLPLTVGLEDGDREMGPFMMSGGEFMTMDLVVASTADAPAVRIEGDYTDASTAVPVTSALVIELDASASIALDADTAMMMPASARMRMLFAIADLFDGVRFPAPDSDGTIHVTRATEDPGKELFHRLTEGITIGFDTDGDGHVDADEHGFRMPMHE